MATPRFSCYFTTDNEEQTIPSSTFTFQSEEGKKASFLLSAPLKKDDTVASFVLESPAHVYIQAVSSEEDDRLIPFVLGGFELVSNSRSLEVYVTDENNKETYLTTCRGIKWKPEKDNAVPQNQQQEQQQPQQQQQEQQQNCGDCWHKVVFVIPGGPRSIKRLRVKMLSIQPPSETNALLHFIKLTGRLPQVELLQSELEIQPQNSATHSNIAHTRHSVPEHVSTHSSERRHHQQMYPSLQHRQTGLIESDTAAAFAGVSMMVRGVEDRLTSVFESGLVQIDQSLSSRLEKLERIIVMQSTAIQQLQYQIQEQSQTIFLQQALVLNEIKEKYVHDSKEAIKEKNVLPEKFLSGENEATILGDDDVDATFSSQNHENTDEKKLSPRSAKMRSSSQTVDSLHDLSSTGSDRNAEVDVEQSKHENVAVMEDDDTLPPSRVRLDKAESDSLVATHSSSSTDDTFDSPNLETLVPSNAGNLLSLGENTDSATESASIQCNNDNPVEDSATREIPTLLRAASLAANDSPPCRLRQDIEVDDVGQAPILEPPDKGYGSPTNTGTPEEPEIDLIDFS